MKFLGGKHAGHTKNGCPRVLKSGVVNIAFAQRISEWILFLAQPLFRHSRASGNPGPGCSGFDPHFSRFSLFSVVHAPLGPRFRGNDKQKSFSENTEDSFWKRRDMRAKEDRKLSGAVNLRSVPHLPQEALKKTGIPAWGPAASLLGISRRERGLEGKNPLRAIRFNAKGGFSFPMPDCRLERQQALPDVGVGQRVGAFPDVFQDTLVALNPRQLRPSGFPGGTDARSGGG